MGDIPHTKWEGAGVLSTSDVYKSHAEIQLARHVLRILENIDPPAE